MVCLSWSTERRIGIVWRQRIEVWRQLCGCLCATQAGTFRLIEGISLRPRRCERIHVERIAKRAAACRGAWPRYGILHQAQLDFIWAEPQTVAVAQAAYITSADRGGIAVHERAIGRRVGELPDTTAIRHGEMALGQQPLWVGHTQSTPGPRPTENSPPVTLRVSGATASGQRRTVIVSCIVSADCGQAGRLTVDSRCLSGLPAGAAHGGITPTFEEAAQSFLLSRNVTTNGCGAGGTAGWPVVWILPRQWTPCSAATPSSASSLARRQRTACPGATSSNSGTAWRHRSIA